MKRDAGPQRMETGPATHGGGHLARGALWIFLARALILPTGFITAVYLTRRLGPVDYGLFALASRLVWWLEWLGGAPFADITVKLTGGGNDWKAVARTALRLYLGTGLFIAALLAAGAPLLADTFGAPSLVRCLRLYALDLPLFLAAEAHARVLVGRGGFAARSITIVARLLTRLFGMLLLVELGWAVIGAVGAMILASGVELVVARRYCPLPLSGGPPLPARRLLATSLPIFVAALSVQLLRLDILLVQAMGNSAAETGYYGAALNLTILLAILSGAIGPPLLSTISFLRARRNDTEALAIAATCLRLPLLLFPLVVLVAAASGEIVLLIFGAAYRPAAVLLAMLLLAALGQFALQLADTLLIAADRAGWALAANLPLVPLALLLHLWLIPRMGAAGAALTTAIVLTTGGAMSVYLALRCWRLALPPRALCSSLLTASAAAALPLLWPVVGVWVLVELAAGTAVVGGILWWSGQITARDLRLASRLFSGSAPAPTSTGPFKSRIYPPPFGDRGM